MKSLALLSINCCLLLCLGLLLPAHLSAQALTGSIEGTIKDAQGAVIAGAEITATQTETNLTRKRPLSIRIQCNCRKSPRFR